MVEVNGLVNSVQLVPRGSEVVADAIIGATTLLVDSVEDFDDAGGDLELNSVRYEYLSCDLETDTIVLATGLTAAAAVGDGAFVVAGGQVAVDHVAFVSTGDGDDAEVLIPFADRMLWSEGDYIDPVPVVLSGDLTAILDVPSRVPTINDTTYESASDGTRVRIRAFREAFTALIEFFAGADENETPGIVGVDDTGIGLALTIVGPHLPGAVAPAITLVSGASSAATTIQLGAGAVEADKVRVFDTLYTDAILPIVGPVKLGNTSNPVTAAGTWKFGVKSVNITALTTTVVEAVAFPVAYDASATIPVINLTFEGASPQQMHLSVSDVTRAGFNIRAHRTAGSTGAVPVHWTALSGPV